MVQRVLATKWEPRRSILLTVRDVSEIAILHHFESLHFDARHCTQDATVVHLHPISPHQRCNSTAFSVQLRCIRSATFQLRVKSHPRCSSPCSKMLSSLFDRSTRSPILE